MESNLIKSITFLPENKNTQCILQFRKKPAHHNDKKTLSKTIGGIKIGGDQNKKEENMGLHHLKFSTQQGKEKEGKQYLKVGKTERLDFQKNKKNKQRMVTNALLPIPVKSNIEKKSFQSLSCENIDILIAKIERKLHTRASSNQGSFDSANSDQIRTSFSIIPETITSPLKISDFQLGKCIGSGKFGDVHICRHKKTNFLFALKKILKSTIAQYKMLPQLINQLKIQYHLDHPNIVKLYNHFDDEYHIFLLMEYAPGGTLMDKIHNTQAYTSILMEQMLQAVSYTHQHKIIHRDIKPENIVVFFDDTFKLCDFGLAAALDYYNDIRTSFCGTLDYIAPEMKDLGMYSFSVDIWGLGVLCYEVLFGKAPFKDEITRWKKRGGKRFSNWNWMIQYPSFTPPSAMTFMSSFLKQNPNQRMSIPSALQSNFIIAQKSKSSALSPSEQAFLSLQL